MCTYTNRSHTNHLCVRHPLYRLRFPFSLPLCVCVPPVLYMDNAVPWIVSNVVRTTIYSNEHALSLIWWKKYCVKWSVQKTHTYTHHRVHSTEPFSCIAQYRSSKDRAVLMFRRSFLACLHRRITSLATTWKRHYGPADTDSWLDAVAKNSTGEGLGIYNGLSNLFFSPKWKYLGFSVHSLLCHFKLYGPAHDDRRNRIPIREWVCLSWSSW